MDRWNKIAFGVIMDTILGKKGQNREKWKEMSMVAKTLEEL